MSAYVNGIKAIIYGFEKEGDLDYIDCYFPEQGYRMPVLADLVYIC